MVLDRLSGKIALITGANKGMGYQTALALAYRNCRVIMADKDCQNESRDKIIAETCNENVQAKYLDLASFQSTRSFVDELQQSEKRLHILINNAGIFCANEKTCDDLDPVVQVNHLGPFLLTNLLVELLKQSGEGRIVFVTSSGAFLHNLSIETMREPPQISPGILSIVLNYYNSKLYNMIASKIFADKLKSYRVTSNCTHPGMTSTDFLVKRSLDDGYLDKGFKYLAKGVVNIATKDVRDSADSLVFLATSDAVKNVSGKYFVNYQEHAYPRVLDDETFCRSIWEESERLVGIS